MSGEPNYFVTKDAAEAIVHAFGEDVVRAQGGIRAVVSDAVQWEGLLRVEKARNHVSYLKVGPLGKECLERLPAPEQDRPSEEITVRDVRTLQHLADERYFVGDRQAIAAMNSEIVGEGLQRILNRRRKNLPQQLARAGDDAEARAEVLRGLVRY